MCNGFPGEERKTSRLPCPSWVASGPTFEWVWYGRSAHSDVTEFVSREMFHVRTEIGYCTVIHNRLLDRRSAQRDVVVG